MISETWPVFSLPFTHFLHLVPRSTFRPHSSFHPLSPRKEACTTRSILTLYPHQRLLPRHSQLYASTTRDRDLSLPPVYPGHRGSGGGREAERRLNEVPVWVGRDRAAGMRENEKCDDMDEWTFHAFGIREHDSPAGRLCAQVSHLSPAVRTRGHLLICLDYEYGQARVGDHDRGTIRK